MNELTHIIVNFGRKCSEYGVSDIVISRILAKRNLKMSAVIRKVNDKLDNLCEALVFFLNSEITRDFLCNDSIHLKEEGTHISAGN